MVCRRAAFGVGGVRVVEYLDRAIDGFDRDPADSDFQRGYLEALKTVRAEAFRTPEGGFAKMFDTPHGQLLAYCDYDDADYQYVVRVIGAGVDGVTPRANLGYDSEEDRQRGFDKIDQAGAEEMALRLHNLVAGMAA